MQLSKAGAEWESKHRLHTAAEGTRSGLQRSLCSSSSYAPRRHQASTNSVRVPTLLPPIQCTYGRGREKEGTGTANWISGHAIKTVVFRHRPFHSPKFCRGCSQHGGFAPEKDDNSQDFFSPSQSLFGIRFLNWHIKC